MKLMQRFLTVFLVMGFISICLTQQGKTETNDRDMSAIISKAEQGDADAQRNLGIMYVEGEGIPQDITQGVYWLSKAAEQGLKAYMSLKITKSL
jgi:TPR repeat protein